MTDQPGWGPPDDGAADQPPPPYPGWSPTQPPATPPTPPAAPTPPPPNPGQPGPGQPGYPPQQGYGAAGPYGAYGAYGYAPPAAPKPGVIPLRPLAVGEILDGAIQCVRANPKIMLGLSAVVVTIAQLISFVLLAAVAGNLNALDPETATPDEVFGAVSGLLGASGIGLVISGLAQVVLSGILTVVVGRAVLGQQISLGDAWTQLRPRLLALIGVSILVFVLASFGLILCILPGIFLYVMWWLAAPALILERAGVITSMKRSWRLVRGSFWRILLIVVLTVILTQVIAGIVSVPFALLAGGFEQFTTTGDSFGTLTTGSLLASTLGAIVSGTLTFPFTAAVTVLVYIDRRMRLEGLDLELARAAAARPSGPPTG